MRPGSEVGSLKELGMDRNFDSTDRSPSEYGMFTLGFVAFMLGAAGVVLSSTSLAFIGAVLLIFAVYSLYRLELRRSRTAAS
jgi:hypothetical protein